MTTLDSVKDYDSIKHEESNQPCKKDNKSTTDIANGNATGSCNTNGVGDINANNNVFQKENGTDNEDIQGLQKSKVEINGNFASKKAAGLKLGYTDDADMKDSKATERNQSNQGACAVPGDFNGNKSSSFKDPFFDKFFGDQIKDFERDFDSVGDGSSTLDDSSTIVDDDSLIPSIASTPLDEVDLIDFSDEPKVITRPKSNFGYNDNFNNNNTSATVGFVTRGTAGACEDLDPFAASNASSGINGKSTASNGFGGSSNKGDSCNSGPANSHKTMTVVEDSIMNQKETPYRRPSTSLEDYRDRDLDVEYLIKVCTCS